RVGTPRRRSARRARADLGFAGGQSAVPDLRRAPPRSQPADVAQRKARRARRRPASQASPRTSFTKPRAPRPLAPPNPSQAAHARRAPRRRRRHQRIARASEPSSHGGLQPLRGLASRRARVAGELLLRRREGRLRARTAARRLNRPARTTLKTRTPGKNP